jgi:hypothetical protein
MEELIGINFRENGIALTELEQDLSVIKFQLIEGLLVLYLELPDPHLENLMLIPLQEVSIR